MSTLGRTPSIQPWFAVLLSGLSTALAVAASLFVSRSGTTASVAALGLSFAFGATVTYATSYQPLIRLKRRRQALLVGIVLRQWMTVYRDEIADCCPRTNVMTVDGQEQLSSILRSKRLSIDYEIDGYSEWERELAFAPGEGAAGMALQEGEIVVYDSQTRRYPERNMTVEQLVATERVTSVISVPIHPSRGRWREPIGVLNLDSTEHVGDTKFNTESARMVLMKYASVIGDILE